MGCGGLMVVIGVWRPDGGYRGVAADGGYRGGGLMVVIGVWRPDGGSYWPIETVVWWYKSICFALPLTMPVRALRSIIVRGWGITHPTVFLYGICYQILITIVFTTVSLSAERKKNKK
ncbi:ABC transporter G family member 20 [Folsomia candida]|uniref:ABC transporter G family member 20 n=1 Tax=Folsomia candida TaxID=158441 RepID=A0A226CW13_FOLCA|nr:ABC transporter G family member 20 [Folsomia candida]